MANEATPRLEMRGISKTFPGVKALNGVQLKAWGGEVHGADGRERRRQVDADEDPLRRLSGRSGRRDPDRRPAGRDHRPDRRQAARHRHHLPGAGARAEPDGRREHLSRRRAATRLARIDRARDERRLPRRCWSGSARRSARTRWSARCRSPSSSWSRSPARCMRKSRILVLDEPTTALSSRETDRLFALIRQLRAEGIAHHLHQPPHGRGLRAGRPRHGAARRRLCRHARPRASSAPKRIVQHDGRARPVELLHQGARRARRAAAPVVLEVRRPDRWRPAGAAVLASRCTRARCWASPGWSAPAAPSWPG